MTVFSDVVHGFASKHFPVKPLGAVFCLTSRCIARCVMCNIWKYPGVDLPLDYILKLIESPIFSKITNVAFTGGETTLREDVHIMVEHLAERSKFLKAVNITTNALMPDRLDDILENLDLVRSRIRPELKILVQVSLDAPDEMHDQIRGVKGAFQKVMDSVSRLNRFRSSHGNVEYYFLCVLQPANVERLDEIDRFFESQETYVVYNLLSDASYVLPDDRSPRFTKEQDNQVANFLKNKLLNEANPLLKFHYNQVIDWLATGIRRRPCGITDQHIVISEDGSLLPCLNHSGNKIPIKSQEDFIDKYWTGDQRKQVRKKLREQICPTCRSFCGPNTFDAFFAFVQLGLLKRWDQITKRMS